MVMGSLFRTGMMGEELGMGKVVGIDGIEEGPGTGWIDGIEEGPRPGTGWIDGSDEGPGTGWEFEFDVDSVEVYKHELVMSQCHTFVEIEIQ
jgi:hypothetical protein